MRIEKTSIRDNSFSLWHRKLCYHWYMNDIDIIISNEGKEEDMTWNLHGGKECEVYALIEEKNSNIEEVDLNSGQFKCFRNLCGDRLSVFLMINHYNPRDKYHTFYIKAANPFGKNLMMKAIGKDNKYLSEQDYIRFEAYLRKEKIPEHLIVNADHRYEEFSLPNIIDYTL